jgi:hypothetical protein
MIRPLEDGIDDRVCEVRGTPTLFIDGVVHLGGYDEHTLLGLLKG